MAENLSQKPERFLLLDVFRGLTIALMILVNSLARFGEDHAANGIFDFHDEPLSVTGEIHYLQNRILAN